MRDENCIFCKIAAGEIPAATLYEDEDFRVILDLNPASKGHALILPKEHYRNLDDLDDKLAAKVKIQGFTVVPLRLYLQDGRAKLEIALARGKSLYDKREDDKVKTMERDARKAMMRY